MGKGNSSSKAAADNRSNQMNPNNSAYHSSRSQSNSSHKNSGLCDEAPYDSEERTKNRPYKFMDNIKEHKKGLGLLVAGSLLGIGLIKSFRDKK